MSKVKFAVFSRSGKSKFASFDTQSCFLGGLFGAYYGVCLWLVLGLFVACLGLVLGLFGACLGIKNWFCMADIDKKQHLMAQIMKEKAPSSMVTVHVCWG